MPPMGLWHTPSAIPLTIYPLGPAGEEADHVDLMLFILPVPEYTQAILVELAPGATGSSTRISDP